MKPAITPSGEDYLDAILVLQKKLDMVRSVDVGREVAEKIYERHCFFTEQLIAAGVDPETTEVDACRIEHVISNESFERLKEATFRNQENEISVLSKEIKDKPAE